MSRRALWATLAVFLFLGGVLAVVSKIIDIPQASMELTAAEKQARTAGVPLTAADVNPADPVPEELNAADSIVHAGQVAKGLPKVDWPQYVNEPSPEHARLLGIYGPVLKEVRVAASLPKCHFARDLDQGALVELPELVLFKDHGKLLAASAVYQARQGNVESAVRDLRYAQNLAVLVQQDPSVISLLVAVSCDAIALKARDMCLAALADRPEALRRFCASAPVRPLPIDVPEICRGDSYMGTATIRNFRAHGGLKGLRDMSNGTARQLTDPKREGMPDGMEERAYMTRHLQLAARVMNAVKPLSNDPVAALTAALKTIESGLQDKRASNMINAVMVPSWAGVVDAVKAGRARTACSQALSQVLLERSATGKIPDVSRLKDWPTDPFDGKPLRARVEGGRIRVYSIGPDLVDDGGATRQEVQRAGPRGAKPASTGDIVSAHPPVRA